MFYGYDPTYILVIIGAILSMIASSFVQSTYSKYSRVQSRTGMTGAQAAQRILQMSGISDVRIEHVSGKLTDHYDPSQKVVRLSDSVYGSTSVAAIGVAAHECGHVVQHHKGYLPMKIRTLLGIPIVLLGLILGLNFHLPDGTYFSLAQIGVYIFTFAVLFQIVTLPVEFNASSRALNMLRDYGMLAPDEVSQSGKVLKAAAMTYVAAAAAAILQLLRLLMLTGRRRRD